MKSRVLGEYPFPADKYSAHTGPRIPPPGFCWRCKAPPYRQGKRYPGLEDVRPFACEIGGLGFAESSYNLSRAWQQLGDREKELQYLKEAAPLLEQYYGGEHPKVGPLIALFRLFPAARLVAGHGKLPQTRYVKEVGEANFKESRAWGGGKMRMPYAELWKKDKAGGRTGL